MRLPTLRPHSRHTRRLHAFVDGNLGAAEAASFERHRAGCDRCQALSAELHALRSALRALPAPVAPRSFRLPPASAVAVAGPSLRPSPRRTAGPWIQNGSRAIGALAAATLAVLVVVDIAPGSGSTASSDGTASLAASAGEAAAGGGQAPEAANSAFAQDSAVAPKATEAVPTFDGSQVTAQAAPGSSGPEASPEPPADDQALTPEPEVQQVSRYDETAAQELAPAAASEGSNRLLRSVQIALGAIAVIAIGASFLVPASKRKVSSR